MTDTCIVHVALYPVEYRLKSVEKYSEGKIHKGEVEPRNGKLCKYCLLHSSGIILESVAMSLVTLTINEQTIANVCLCLCRFQPRIMYVKYTFTN